MTPEEEKLDYWKPQLGDGILVGDTDFYWVSSDEAVKGCPDGGGCTLNYAVDRYLDGAAVVIYRESAGSFQALQSENARLRKVVEQCKELSGRKMDYGSDSDAIQGIYILTYNALNSKPESGV